MLRCRVFGHRFDARNGWESCLSCGADSYAAKVEEDGLLPAIGNWFIRTFYRAKRQILRVRKCAECGRRWKCDSNVDHIPF